MGNREMLDLVAEAQNDLYNDNFGKVRGRLAKLEELIMAKVIKKQKAGAAENTKKIMDALAAFKGKTPEEIAADLLAQGHKGDTGDSRHCPMARYLTAADGEVRVDGETADFEGGSVDLDDNVRRFVTLFDQGEFPDLVGGDDEDDDLF